jgi:hypothetical protein
MHPGGQIQLVQSMSTRHLGARKIVLSQLTIKPQLFPMRSKLAFYFAPSPWSVQQWLPHLDAPSVHCMQVWDPDLRVSGT